MKSNHQSGFTLVEIAVVTLIAGMLMAGAIVMMKPYFDSAQKNATKYKLEQIGQALALYYQNYKRLPCPADPNPSVEPFGSPRLSGVNGTDWQNTCGTSPVLADFMGVLPFRVLGLEEENARDSYGNMITYAVSPVLAGYQSTNRVHEMCRTSTWIKGGVNQNPAKARFCCPNNVGLGNVVIRDARSAMGTTIFTRVHSTTGYSADVNSLVTSATPGSEIIAYILVSHGPNGDGAVIDRSDEFVPLSARSGAHEGSNWHDGNISFITRPETRTEDNNYFDDIIYWRTNHQIVSAFGNDSCAKL